MRKILGLTYRCSTLTPSKGFDAIYNSTSRAQVLKTQNQKLDALTEVLLSLPDQEIQYLNLILAQNSLKSGQNILSNRVINRRGYRIDPIAHFQQQQQIKNEWKQTNLLQFILSDELEEMGQKIQVEVVKENYDVQLTSLDAAQKIKIIKVLRELFGLGLKQAKDFADRTPSMLKKNMKRQQAEKLKKDLQAAGCVITLK